MTFPLLPLAATNTSAVAPFASPTYWILPPTFICIGHAALMRLCLSTCGIFNQIFVPNLLSSSLDHAPWIFHCHGIHSRCHLDAFLPVSIPGFHLLLIMPLHLPLLSAIHSHCQLHNRLLPSDSFLSCLCNPTSQQVSGIGPFSAPVSYTHLTLPTKA